MALEAAVFSQDPLLSYFCSKDLYPLLAGSWNNNYDYNFTNYSSLFSADDEKQAGVVGLFDPDTIIPPPAASATPTPPSIPSEAREWDHHQKYLPNSSPETRTGSGGHLHEYHQLVGSAAPGREVVVISGMDGTTSAPSAAVAAGGGRRKRRRVSTKNKEEVENQRMTHIAVERNRRKQMNEYLAAIKSMMPPPYVQRGDQASIIGGAINYVKELEQLLHSLESQKRINQQRQKPDNDYPTSAPPPPIFADFFTFPQFSRAAGSAIHHQRRSSSGGGCNTSSTLINSSMSMDEDNKRAITVEDTNSSSNKINDDNNGIGTSSSSCGAEIEVTMVDTHANVKILVKRQPKQLLKLVTSFQNVRLSVLHLNLTTTTTTTVDNMVLYSFSLKVEEGSQFNSVEEIAAAANHILEKIQRDSNPAVSFLI